MFKQIKMSYPWLSCLSIGGKSEGIINQLQDLPIIFREIRSSL